MTPSTNPTAAPALPATRPAAAPATFWRRSALAASAVGLVAVGALAATLWHRPADLPAGAVSTPAAMAPTAAQPVPAAPAMADRSNAAGRPTPAAAMPVPGTRPATATAHAPATHTAQGSTPLNTQPTGLPASNRAPAAAVCDSCGVVEQVTAVSHAGQGTGLGAVAGGVLGGVVGHQIGGGKGRNAMAVLGAIGGGLAGNEIEKRQRATTDYRVTVRMADGSLRTLTQAHAPAVGQAVRVEGDRLLSRTPAAPSPAPYPASGDGDVRTLQTSQRG